MTITQAARIVTARAYDEGIRCPACGGRLELVVDGFVGMEVADACFEEADNGYRMVPKQFTACTECEFAIPIDDGEAR